MEQIKRILVPTDFSELADNSLQAALMLASSLKAEIFVVHFYHLLLSMSEIDQTANPTTEYEFRLEFDSRLKEIQHNARFKYPDLVFHNLVQEGDMLVNIPEIIEAHKIDLLVLGTHGTNIMEEYVYGNNTTAVLKIVTIPVFVVPKSATLVHLKKIVVATNFQERDMDVIKKVSSIAEHFHATIEIVHFSDHVAKGKKNATWMTEFDQVITKNISTQFKNLSHSAVSHTEVNKYLADEKVDLFVMTTKGKNLYERLFSGSFTRDMLCHGHISMLIYHI